MREKNKGRSRGSCKKDKEGKGNKIKRWEQKKGKMEKKVTGGNAVVVRLENGKRKKKGSEGDGGKKKRGK